MGAPSYSSHPRMVLVTGSSGLVGASIVATLRERFVTRGLDLTAAPTTEVIGDLRDRDVRRRALSGAWAVVHAAALHAPHVAVHPPVAEAFDRRGWRLPERIDRVYDSRSACRALGYRPEGGVLRVVHAAGTQRPRPHP